MHNQYLIKIVIAPLAVLILHLIATLAGWYELIWWLDKPLHLLGGVAIAISAYYLIAYFKSNGKMQINWIPLQLLAIFAVVALSALCWEFLEFYIDKQVFTVMQPSVYDTITDLIMGMFGGTITGTLMSYLSRKK